MIRLVHSAPNGHNTRTYIWHIADLTAPQPVGAHTHAIPVVDHNLYVHWNHVYESNFRGGLRILALTDLASAQLTEVGYFDVWPEDDEAAFFGTWSNYPFFRSGVVAVSGNSRGLFLVAPTNLPPAHFIHLPLAVGQ